MEHPSPPSIIDILRNTLRRLEKLEGFRQEDAAVIELKRHIVQSIAELEVSKSASWQPAAGRSLAGAAQRSRGGD